MKNFQSETTTANKEQNFIKEFVDNNDDNENLDITVNIKKFLLKLKQIVENNPNDGDLGKKLRTLYLNYNKGKY